MVSVPTKGQYSSKQVSGEGPIPCEILLIGERPGIEEIRRGRPFCGPAGQELDRYLLNNSGLSRTNVRVTNLVKDYRDGANPEQWEVDRDITVLRRELVRVHPTYIGCVGLWSTRALLDPETDMEWAHGLAFPTATATLMPLIHPAAGLHHPADAIKIAWDFEQFGKMVRGEQMPMGHL